MEERTEIGEDVENRGLKKEWGGARGREKREWNGGKLGKWLKLL